MPHPCALIEEGMQGFEACQAAELAVAAGKVLGETPAETVATLKETLIANAPVITERLNSALAKIGEWVEVTEEFAFEQAPLLVQEIVWWGIADGGYWVAFGVFFLTLAFVWGRACYKRWERIEEMSGDSGDFMRFMVFVLTIIPAIAGLLLVMINIMGMLKPIVAPRLYLIEYFRQLAE